MRIGFMKPVFFIFDSDAIVILLCALFCEKLSFLCPCKGEKKTVLFRSLDFYFRSLFSGVFEPKRLAFRSYLDAMWILWIPWP